MLFDVEPGTVGHRLGLILEIVYGDVVENLALAMQQKAPSLYPYLKGHSLPGTPWLQRFGAIGFNVHWIVMNEGEMFSDTPTGKKLRAKYGAKFGVANAKAIPVLPEVEEELTLTVVLKGSKIVRSEIHK